MKKITGVLVNVSEGTARKVTIERSLESYYKAIDCTCIDIVNRRLGGYRFDVICDDEALLKENPIPSAFDLDDQPMLYGNLFFCKPDGAGDLVSLDDVEVSIILSRCYDTWYLHGSPHRWLSVRRLDY